MKTVVVVVDLAAATVVVGATVVDVVDVVVPLLGATVVVGDVDVTLNEIDAEVAAACEPLAAMDAVIVHVPELTKVTTPVDELTVHTDVVELEYDFEPPPAEAVEVIVGGVSPMSYVDVYEPASMVNVRELVVMVNVLVDEVAVP